MSANYYNTPLAQVARVHDGVFYDDDGSLYVLPENTCAALDDDCACTKMTKDRRQCCARGELHGINLASEGQCPFIPD